MNSDPHFSNQHRHAPENRCDAGPTPAPARWAGLSTGQAALLYHFEDLMLEHAARNPLSGELALRAAGAIEKLAQINRRCGEGAEAVIIAGGMTAGHPADGFVLSQLRGRDAGSAAERFVLPLVESGRPPPTVAAPAPWRWEREVEVFEAPVGVVGHAAASRSSVEVFSAYSPQAQDEALDHIDEIAQLFNRDDSRRIGHYSMFPASSVLLSRVLERILDSNARGDPDIFGEEAVPVGPPVLGIQRVALERGSPVAFHVDLMAVRISDLPGGGAGRIYRGGVFCKEYTVCAKRGPLAFEDMRVVDLVERAA